MLTVNGLAEPSVRRVDGRTAGAGRILAGFAALLLSVEEGVTISRVFGGSSLRLPYADWLPALPLTWLPALLLCWWVLALLFIVGWHVRAAGLGLTLILAYVLSLDQQTYSNHLYLLLLVICLLSLANPSVRYSIDARLGRARPDAPYWPLLLLKLQLSIVYFFAAASKLNPLYLSGAVLAENMREGSAFQLPEALDRWEALAPLALASICLEFFLAFAFWSPRYRSAALLVGVAFHLVILATMPAGAIYPLTVYTLVMFALYAQFADLPALQKRLARLRRRTAFTAEPAA